MVEHTPGPYSVTEEFIGDDHYYCILAPDGDTILADVCAHYDRDPAHERAWMVNYTKTRANANLFAAAPDLLRVCEDLNAVLGNGKYLTCGDCNRLAELCDTHVVIADLRDAIAKARGEVSSPADVAREDDPLAPAGGDGGGELGTGAFHGGSLTRGAESSTGEVAQ